MASQYSVAMLPFPIDLEAALAFYLLRRANRIGPHTMVAYHFGSSSFKPEHKPEGQEDGKKDIIFLFGDGLKENLIILADRIYIHNVQSTKIKELVEFVFRIKTDGRLRKRKDIEAMIEILAEKLPLRAILEHFENIFRFALIENLDLEEKRFTVLPVQLRCHLGVAPKLPEDILKFSIPDEEGEFSQLEVDKSRASKLCNQSLMLGVVGPSGVGKSTIAASVYAKMVSQLKSIPELPVTVSCLDADMACPSLSAVLAGRGGERGFMEAGKAPGWSRDLLRDTVYRLEAARQNGMVIVDTPGGEKKDAVRLHTLALLDMAVLVLSERTLDQEVEWRETLQELGIKLVAKITANNAGGESRIVSCQPGEFFEAIIYGVQREVISRGSVIKALSSFLLFACFPDFVEWRDRKIKEAKMV